MTQSSQWCRDVGCREEQEQRTKDKRIIMTLHINPEEDGEIEQQHTHDVDEREQQQTHDDPDVIIRHFLVSTRMFRPSGGSRNNTRESDRNTVLPGAYRINATTRIPQARPLPEAYPVFPATIIDPESDEHSEQDEQHSDPKNASYFSWKKAKRGIIIFVVIGQCISIFYLVRLITTADANGSQPTLTPSVARYNITSNSSLQEQNEKPLKECFLDPREIHMHEESLYMEGVDPSIPRTYNICPNSHLKIQKYDYQFGRYDINSGDYAAFTFFRPNIILKCGFDGDYNNNCSLSGGETQVFLLSESVFEADKVLETKVENITLEGFRFTGGYRGTNIMNYAYVASLTLKNCVFNYNHEMFSSIMSAAHYAIKSTLNVQNCIFEHNTYSYFRSHGTRPNIGVIASYPVSNTDAIVNTYISNTIFRNETFLLNVEPEFVPSPILENVTPEGALVNGAIINLVTAIGALDVTNSCFVGNEGIDSLIILDKDHRTILQDSHGNYFADNESRESDKLSCISYQNISYVDYWPMALLEDKEDLDCNDHYWFDNDSETNAEMCSRQL